VCASDTVAFQAVDGVANKQAGPAWVSAPDAENVARFASLACGRALGERALVRWALRALGWRSAWAGRHADVPGASGAADFEVARQRARWRR